MEIDKLYIEIQVQQFAIQIKQNFSNRGFHLIILRSIKQTTFF